MAPGVRPPGLRRKQSVPRWSRAEYTTSMDVGGQTVKTVMKTEVPGQEMHEGKMMNHYRTTVKSQWEIGSMTTVTELTGRG